MKKLVFVSFFIFLLLIIKSAEADSKFLYQINDVEFEAIAVCCRGNGSTILVNDIKSNRIYVRFEVLTSEYHVIDEGYDHIRYVDENGNLIIKAYYGEEDFPFYNEIEFTIPNVKGEWLRKYYLPEEWVWEGYITVPKLPVTLYIPFAVIKCAEVESFPEYSDCYPLSWDGFDFFANILPNVTLKVNREETKLIHHLTVTREMWEDYSFPIFEKFVINSEGESLQGKKIHFRYRFEDVETEWEHCDSEKTIVHPDKISLKCSFPGIGSEMKPGKHNIHFSVWFKDPFYGPKLKELDSLDWVMEVSNWNVTFNFKADKTLIPKNGVAEFSGEYLFNGEPVTGKYVDIYFANRSRGYWYTTSTNKDGKFNYRYSNSWFGLSPGVYSVYAGVGSKSLRCSKSLSLIVYPIIKMNILTGSINPGEEVTIKTKLKGEIEKRVHVRENSCSGVEKCSCDLKPEYYYDPKEINNVGFKNECNCSFNAPSSPGDYTYYACIDLNGNGKIEEGEYEQANLTVISQAQYSLNLNQGWNLISLPVNKNIKKEDLPTACNVQGDFWYYSQGWKKTQELNPGRGYWIKAGSACKITLDGDNVELSDFPQLNKGWNLIGSPTEAVDLSEIGCTIQGKAWEYDQGWKKTDKLEPGYGYWVKCQ